MPEYTYYKIVSKDENIKDCYVGKTTNFKKRVQRHKSNCYNENSEGYYCKLYKYIRENGCINNWSFIEIETNEYDKKDSAIRERELIEELNATLNNVIPSRTLKEYCKNNKEKIKEYQNEYCKNNKEKLNEYQKEYRKNNKDIINEYFKEYRKNNKEKIKEYRENNEEYFKKYRKNNKEVLKKYQKEYRKNNKDILNEKIICECGCEIFKKGLSRHLKTQKHINLMS